MDVFSTLDQNIQQTLIKLEETDSAERKNNVSRAFRLRQIPRETGEFLYQLLYSSAIWQQEGFSGIEFGTSGGYSAIWQGLALKHANNTLHSLATLENDAKKITIASENIKQCGLEKIVHIQASDAKEYVKDLLKKGKKFSYAFIDAEKEDYLYYYQQAVLLLRSNGFIIADNVISHKEDMKEFLTEISKDKRVTSTILTIGKGLAYVIVK